MKNEADDKLKWCGDRIGELENQGLDLSSAIARMKMEQRLAEWPEEWGKSLRILIYGDFKPICNQLQVDSLGITVYPGRQSDTVIGQSLCVLRASVEVNERTVAGLNDAARRINALLGAWTLWSHGNAAFGWWSDLSHGSTTGVYADLECERMPETLSTLEKLSPDISKKVRSALYWVRSSRAQFTEQHKNDTLRMYAAYWNAFECLVDAVLKVSPTNNLKKKDKEESLKKLMEAREGKLTIADVDKIYRELINPGFVARAKHALTVCFPEHGAIYAEECFFRVRRHPVIE